MSGIGNGVTNKVIELSKVRPHPANYQIHPEAQIALLKESDAKFGQVRSFVVQEDGAGGYLLVAGHGYVSGRMANGEAMGRADIIPADWQPVKVLAYLSVDNESARLSEQDHEMMRRLAIQIRNDDEELAEIAMGGKEALELLLMEVQANHVDKSQGADKGGDESTENEFWPTIMLRVPPDVHDRFLALLKLMPGQSPHEQFTALLDLAKESLPS